MAQHLSFIAAIVVALFITALSNCSAENVYCVTPTATSCSSCPYHYSYCTTLSEYVQDAELYFTSNTTMVFLPGDHTLDMNITVANVTRLTVHGESSSGKIATIVCKERVGLSFTNMMELKIHSLTFTYCRRKYDIFPASNYALLLHSTQYSELVNCSFRDNLGTALVVNNTSVNLAGTSEFTHNHCDSDFCLGGSGITALSSNLTFSGSTTFLENNATFYGLYDWHGGGGAIYASSNTVLSFTGTSNFINNSAVGGGGAVYASESVVLSFCGACNFINNSATYGGAISASGNILLTFNGTSKFISNCVQFNGGAIYTFGNNAVSFHGTYYFINNSATSDFANGGAIAAYANSILTFNGTIYFTNNGGRRDAMNGGGVFMGIKCIFSILPNTTMYWENNHANLGGAIYVQDASPMSYCDLYIPREECFFQLPGQNLFNAIDVRLVFKNNIADAAGSVLYGGAIDNCKLTGFNSHSSGDVFDMISHNIDTDYRTTSNISSDALGVCPCENNQPVCKRITQLEVYPGETFHVSVLAVGQRAGTVPSTVRSIIVLGQVDLQPFQYLQAANNSCSNLSYTVFSLSQHVGIQLHAEGSQCSKYQYEILPLISLSLNQTCPPGFTISRSEKSCICEPRLIKYTRQCNITNGLGRVTRESNQHFWIGFSYQSHGLILHPHCPFDYCVTDTVVFPFNNTGIQCAYNRSGLLCGRCKKGYSLVLGTTHCRKCTNNSYLLLLIPFALMGVALIILLFVCKLTVASGTISGLIFYANIIGANRNIFLPVDSTSAFSIFIAWLNLDFGIETCFYNGMDAYSKTWLQFVFPVYIWVLVGLVIVVSNHSRRFAKLLGNNPVSVLATLILLSYTKILRTLIAVMYITYLEYPTYSRRVWLYDANIDYLSGKHIPLFIVAVVFFLFLFLPYTLLLLFGQWLQALSHLRLFSWVTSARLKPFMDSYHAPYKPKHRYWPGLLLVLRFVLLLVFAFDTTPQQDKANPNLLAILVGTGALQVWAWVSGGVYERWYLDVLESSFALNLIILVGATYYVKLAEGNQLAVGYTSVSIALVTFIGILVFPLAKVTAAAIRKRYQVVQVEPLDNDFLTDQRGEYEPLHTPPEHVTTGEPTEREVLVNIAQERLIPVYTYDPSN